MRKKILMIIPKLSDGGAERVVSNLSMQLQHQYEMDILVDWKDIQYPYSGKAIVVDPTHVRCSNIIHELLVYVKKAFILKKMKRKHLYDCYISHSDISNILNLLTGNKGCKVILTLHNQSANRQQDSRISGIIEFFEKNFYKNANQIITVSNGVAGEFVEKYSISHEKITAIWNGTDIGNIEQKAQLPLPKEQEEWFTPGRTVTTMGRCSQQKGQIHLIRAFTEVVKKYQDAKLLLLGTGELYQSFKHLIQELKLEKNVILCGFQENPFSIIARSDVFVFPSLWEGFGYALEEAICCRVPCISTDFKYGAREIMHYRENEMPNGITEAIYTDFGVLVPVCRNTVRAEENICLSAEEKIIAEAIIAVLRDEKYRQKIIEKNNSRLEEFSLEKMGKQWSEVIGK